MVKVAHQRLKYPLAASQIYQNLCGKQSGYHGMFYQREEDQSTIIARAAIVMTAKDFKLEITANTAFGKELMQALVGTRCDQFHMDIPKLENIPISERERLIAPCVFDLPRKLLHLIGQIKDLPKSAQTLLGVLGFECVQYFEKLKLSQCDPLCFPDFVFLFPQEIAIVQDEVIDYYCLNHSKELAQAALQQSVKKLSCSEHQPAYYSKNSAMVNTSAELFKTKINALKEKIKQGSLFQCVIARRFMMGLQNPFQAYLELIKHNSAPYHFFIHLESHCIFGASVETAVKIQTKDHQRQIYLRPLAGTIRANQNQHALKQDPKELAEHMMLVDLARNDLARICKPGSRHVTELAQVKQFNHLCHIRSQVQGILEDTYDAFHSLKACLPMGTLSGAPKIKAIQTLIELEEERRGPYGGTTGLFYADGSLDTAIIIRACCVRDAMGHVSAGAGIVKASNPEKEVAETELKAERLLNVLSGGYV